MTNPKPTIADLFDAFFTDACSGQAAAAQQRTLRVRASLEAYLESRGFEVLTDDRLALLRTEQQFVAERAFVRTMFADDLLFALPGYLEPRLRSPDPAEARSQVVLVGKLAQWMWNAGLFGDDDVSCAIYTLEAALTEARRGLAAARGANAR